MKRPLFVYTLEFLLFLAFVGVSFLLLAPASKRLDGEITRFRDGMLTRLETVTGLEFSYSSLSPSIFRSIKIRDLVVRDVSNGSVIAKFSEVSVVYGFARLISGDLTGSVRDIVIRDGAVSVDTGVNALVIANLRAVLGGGGSGASGLSSLSSGSPSSLAAGERDIASIPANGVRVHVDNVSMSVRDGAANASFALSHAHAAVTADGILFGIDGSVTLAHPLLALSATTSASLSVNGTVDRAFDAGTVSVMLTAIESGNYSLSKLGLMVSFRDGTVTCNSVGSLEPVDIHAEWDGAAQRLSASARCDALLPLRWIHVKSGGESSIVRKLENISISGSASLTMESGAGAEYSIDMRAELPSALSGGGQASIRCSGDASKLRIDGVSFFGPSFDVSGYGTYDFATRMPEGYLDARKILMRNGSVLSTEMYAQPEGTRFICLFPEIAVNGATFSSVECAIEPGTEALDFSVSAYDESGHIGMEGSWSFGARGFLELYSSFDSIRVSNAARAYSAIAKPDADVSAWGDGLSPFALTTELYLSTDLSEFSFNCTRLVLASEEKNGLYLLLSAKGNANGIDFTDIRFSSGGYDFAGNVYAVLEEDGSLAFNADATVNAIPYALSGSWGDGNLILFGDYGFSATALFGTRGMVSGFASATGIPVSAGANLVSVSFDASFNYASVSDWNVRWNSASVEEVGNALPLSTVVSCSGMTGPRGAILDSVTLSDRVSTLGGSASLIPDGDGGYDATLSLSSADGVESISANGTVSLADAFSYSGTIRASSVPLMRFVRGQLPSSRLTATATGVFGASGIEATAEIGNLVWRFGDFDLEGKGSVAVSGARLDATGVSATWNGHSVSGLEAGVSLDTYDATVSAGYSVILGKSPLSARIAASFKPRDNLDNFALSLTLSDAKWKTWAPGEPFAVEFDHTPGVTAVTAGKNGALSGYLLDDGSFNLQSGTSIPVSFNADGKIASSALSIRVNDLSADLSVIWPLLGVTMIDFPAGSVSGDLTIDGLLNDPEFHGVLHASGLVVNAPGLLGETFSLAGFDLAAEGKTITVPETVLKGKDGSCKVSADIGFDRWLPATLAIHAETLPGDAIRVAVENQFTRARGYGSFNVDFRMDSGFYELGGSLEFERGAFVILFSGFEPSTRTVSSDLHDWKINLALNVGKKVEFRWPTDEFPVIRGLVQAEKPITLDLDTSVGSFSVKGDANLKGGQIFYLKQNFYLRKGTIVFNENENFFDPMLTVLAEIRENDENGKPVRIILSVDNKPLSTFMPILSSDPPKTDVEIMALLGQTQNADPTRVTVIKDAVITTSDILTQMSLFRNAENSVRDLLNLDIFSIRTLILQNAIFGPGERAASGTDSVMTIGNYFDNTTVYIGKYLGSSIYADALMHFSYFDPLTTQTSGENQIVYQNLLIQPEFGFEVTTPLFLVRFAVTPMRPDTLFIADSSITLSRKFSY